MTATVPPDPAWIPLAAFRATFRGPPNGAQKAWWRTDNGALQLDDVLFGADGVMDGKGGCGAQFCTHIRLVGADELPAPPAGTAWRR